MRFYKKFPDRDSRTTVKLGVFQTLEQAVHAYLSDGNVDLPNSPEGSFDFADLASVDLDADLPQSVDRIDAAAKYNRMRQAPPQPLTVEPTKIEQPTPEPPKPAPAPTEP